MERIAQFRKKLADGKMVKGFFLNLADPAVSEMAGYAGYDYEWIDAEHGPLGRAEILRHVMAAQGTGCCAFVRVPGASITPMKAILDMGPDGIIFPFINSAEDARRAVAACSYPDSVYHGVRGQGPIRAIRYGLIDEGEYLRTAYEQVFKVMQIETLEGYNNLDAIMQVQGVDCIFIGGADLSRSIAGNSSGHSFAEVRADICKRVRAAGLTLGAAIGVSPEDARASKESGIQFIVFGQDARILSGGLKANLEVFKDY
ncbi:5-keto-4-deoxy-D-glucarate aldolase [Spirochaetia bacterium]|nr:5-keto-4-deoxy-D-glucarate aldolase [Spirochaetia bacterium]